MPERRGYKRRWSDRLTVFSVEGGPETSLERGAELLAERAAHGREGGLRYALQPAAMEPGHRLRLLVDGAETFTAMLEAIASARHWIDLETYIWENDATGKRFAAALAERARAGCEVRCIVDDAGSIGTDFSLFDELRTAGGEVAIFHPVGPWRRRWGWSVRDHRKLMVVDGRVAFTGGINLGDEYAPRHWGGQEWHDLHLLVEGPAVHGLQRLFVDCWRYIQGPQADRLLERRVSSFVPQSLPPVSTPGPLLPPALDLPGQPPGALVRQAQDDQPAAPLVISEPPPPPAEPGPSGLARPLAVGRRRDRRFIQRHLQYAVALARKRVFISSAYFIPNRAWRRTLRKAAVRGVDVRVLVPRTNDIPPVHYAGRYTYQRLLDAGVRIFEYLPSMMHAKAIVVDGCWGSVGSYNLDQRSLMYNLELVISMVDPPVCAQLERQFLLDLDKCREIDPLLWPKRGLLHKLRERFWYFFRLLL